MSTGTTTGTTTTQCKAAGANIFSSVNDLIPPVLSAFGSIPGYMH